MPVVPPKFSAAAEQLVLGYVLPVKGYIRASGNGGFRPSLLAAPTPGRMPFAPTSCALLSVGGSGGIFERVCRALLPLSGARWTVNSVLLVSVVACYWICPLSLARRKQGCQREKRRTIPSGDRASKRGARGLHSSRCRTDSSRRRADRRQSKAFSLTLHPVAQYNDARPVRKAGFLATEPTI